MPQVIDMRSGPDPLERYLAQWMQRSAREEEIRAEEERRQQEQATRDEMARNAALARQFATLSPQQQREVFAGLPDGAKAFVLDPGNVPMDPWEEVRYKQGQHAATIDPATQPPEVVTSMIHQASVGAAMPTAVTESIVRRDSMTPEEFDAGQRKGYTEMTPQQEALTPSQIAENEAQAEAAQALKAQRMARESEIREPSPERGGAVPPKAPPKAAPNNAAQRQVEDYNRQLRQLSDREMKAIADFNAAGGDDPDRLTKKQAAQAKSVLVTVRSQMQTLKEKRDRLASGMARVGIAAPSDATSERREINGHFYKKVSGGWQLDE